MEDARDIVGRTVLVKLESCEGMEFTGIESEGPFFCRVKAVDEAGVWVENRKFMTVELRDSRGRKVPKSKQKPRRHTVNILLPWRTVQTIIMFEDEEEANIAIEEAALGEGVHTGRIGFIK